jgi:ABC-type branched-subunit amino acid transport system permease subunit
MSRSQSTKLALRILKGVRLIIRGEGVEGTRCRDHVDMSGSHRGSRAGDGPVCRGTRRNVDDAISPRGLFELSLGALLGVYLLLRVLLACKMGRVIVASKENEQRLLLLGYDSRAYKLFTFVLGAAIAGLSGCLFANWGAFTSPTVFGLAQSAQIIIWIIVGGLGTLVGPVVGCVAIQWLTAQIGTQQTINSNLVLGAILVVFVLMVPKGIVPALGELGMRITAMLRRSRKTAGAGEGAAASHDDTRESSRSSHKEAA